MNPLSIIEKYYEKGSPLYDLYVKHCRLVTDKALAIAKHSGRDIDLQFVEEAGMLHDIGIFLTDAPPLYCMGDQPYICHGYLGHDLLVKEGLPKHALVCERHTGMGLTLADIEHEKLPLPKRDMMPVSLEEKLICLADKFYSKTPGKLEEEKTIEEIEKGAAHYGEEQVKRFREMLLLFNYSVS